MQLHTNLTDIYLIMSNFRKKYPPSSAAQIESVHESSLNKVKNETATSVTETQKIKTYETQNEKPKFQKHEKRFPTSHNKNHALVPYNSKPFEKGFNNTGTRVKEWKYKNNHFSRNSKFPNVDPKERKTPQNAEPEMIELIKNVRDCIQNPETSQNYRLPKPPYAMEWSQLFRNYNFPEQLVNIIEKFEFDGYVDQPFHKEGAGLFYGNFNQLPPRFQKMSFQYLDDYFQDIGIKYSINEILNDPSIINNDKKLEKRITGKKDKQEEYIITEEQNINANTDISNEANKQSKEMPCSYEKTEPLKLDSTKYGAPTTINLKNEIMPPSKLENLSHESNCDMQNVFQLLEKSMKSLKDEQELRPLPDDKYAKLVPPRENEKLFNIKDPTHSTHRFYSNDNHNCKNYMQSSRINNNKSVAKENDSIKNVLKFLDNCDSASTKKQLHKQKPPLIDNTVPISSKEECNFRNERNSGEIKGNIKAESKKFTKKESSLEMKNSKFIAKESRQLNACNDSELKITDNVTSVKGNTFNHEKLSSQQFHYKQNSDQFQKKANTDQFHSKANTGQFHSKANTDQFHSKANTGQFHNKANTGQFHNKANTGQFHSKANIDQFHSKANANQLHNKANTDQLRNKANTDQLRNKANTDQLHNKANTDQLRNKANTDQFRNKANTDQFHNKANTDQLHNKANTDQLHNKTKNSQFNSKPIGSQFHNESKRSQFNSKPNNSQFHGKPNFGKFQNKSVSEQFGDKQNLYFEKSQNKKINRQFSHETDDSRSSMCSKKDVTNNSESEKYITQLKETRSESNHAARNFNSSKRLDSSVQNNKSAQTLKSTERERNHQTSETSTLNKPVVRDTSNSNNSTNTLSNKLKIYLSETRAQSYWEDYFQNVLFHKDFVVQNFNKTSNVLHLVINDSITFTSSLTLLRKETNILKKPHVVYVSIIKPHIDTNESIIKKSKSELEKLYNRYCEIHDIKMRSIDKKLILVKGKKIYNKNPNFDEEYAALNSYRNMLEQMANIYQNAIDKINYILELPGNNLTFSEVKKLETNFRHECNFFEGCLPVYSMKDQILDVVARNTVSVLIAETGSGKSTQLAQYLLQAGFADKGIIVCTQPRKVAAVSIARYISKLRSSHLGDEVGYETGLSKKISESTKIIYMTDYTLMRKCIQNRTFKGISCVIVDEAHERSLYTDLLLGLIKRCLVERPDLKVIVTSATIDPTIFLNYFGASIQNAVVKIPGRNYPVTTHWYPSDVSIDWDYYKATVKKTFEVHCQSEKGGILVFLPTPREIENAIEDFIKLEKSHKRSIKFKAKLMKLHGRLDTEDQLQIFEPVKDGFRKIIFATNSAETSITINGIKFVIDSGMSKQRTYDSDKKRSVLVIGFVNKSSAEQRKGRAGRTEPGVCYRMYSEKNFVHDMQKVTLPEILRVNLNQAILEILHLGIQPKQFDFVNAPSEALIDEALMSLENLGAIAGKQVTPLGKQIVKIPLDPQLSKFILCGIEKEIGYASVIASAMVVVSGRVFLRPEDKKKDADAAKRIFCYLGDFQTLIYLYLRWSEKFKSNSDEATKWCFDNFVNSRAMHSASQIVNDLCRIISTELKKPINRILFDVNNASFEGTLEEVLFDCFSENICVFSGHEKSGYLSPFHNGTFFIHPSSAIIYSNGELPKYILFESILKTSRTFLLNVTPIREKTIIIAHKAGKFQIPIESLKEFQVLPNIIRPIGESVLINHILGKDGYKIHEIENTIQAITKEQNFYIDVNVKKGEIISYVDPHNQKFVNDTVKKYIEKAHEELKKEEMLITNFYPFTYALSYGGKIQDVVLPGEFKELTIEYKTSYCNIPSLISKLEKLGMISYYENALSKKIIAVFPKVSQAENALSNLKLSKDYNISANPYIPLSSQKPLPIFVVKVLWNRSPCKGTGWIEFEDSNDCLTACFKLVNEYLCVDGNYIDIEPSDKGKKTIYMRNIPPHLGEEDVELVLNKRLNDIKFKVTLCRFPISDVKECEIANIKKDLQRIFSPYTSPKNITIHVKYPNVEDKIWKAFVSFTNLEEGNNAVSSLCDKIKINNIKAHLKPILKFTLLCRRLVEKVLKRSIESYCIKQCREGGRCHRYTIEPKGDDFVSITLFCQKTEDLLHVRKELSKLVEGHCLPCNNNENLLALLNSKTVLREIESNYRTLILPDVFKKMFFIYGNSESACNKTIQQLLSLGKHTARRKVFDLASKSMPLGFLKTLCNKHGVDLKNLINKFDLQNASIDIMNHQLVLEGSSKNLIQVQTYLEEICSELYENHEKLPAERKNAGTDECPVCFDTNLCDIIRLEHCGHAVCKLCLHLQLQSGSFPLNCVKKDCGKPFFVEDLRHIFIGHDNLKKNVCDTALKYFVQTHSREVHYCPTPNCQMLYRLNPEDPEFKCPHCENDICTMCHCTFHHGMSCDMYKKTLTDEHYPLRVWLNEDTGNRKTCPVCESAIEKDGGCNHIICSNCQSHLCWLCLSIFKTSEDVYEHMSICASEREQ